MQCGETQKNGRKLSKIQLNLLLHTYDHDGSYIAREFANIQERYEVEFTMCQFLWDLKCAQDMVNNIL